MIAIPLACRVWCLEVSRREMRVLVVGAGSVGQVLAHHLIKGGCEVTFLVKDARVEKLSKHNPRVHWLSMLMPRRGQEKDEVRVPAACLRGSPWKKI